jgi:uridine kinase
LERVANEILQLPPTHVRRVGVDGVDGAGKTVFADELAVILTRWGQSVIRASADAFHNPRHLRYRLGKHSPEGFFRDSYNYDKVKELLLDPLSPQGNMCFRRAVYDIHRERPVDAQDERAQPGAILVFDGIFLHRPELRTYWDYSVFLEVSFEISVPRGAQRGMGSADPVGPPIDVTSKASSFT